jgi:DNA-binding NarL/FixJ family response regulator
MTAAGAHVRTAPEPFLRALVFDRRAAVLRDYTPWTGEGPEPKRALIVEDEGLVHYVAAAFDREWSLGQNWRGERAVPPASADDPLTPRQQEIARQLAAGGGQAAVATALRISERVVQNELSAMRRVLGCSTNGALLFELGRRAGRAERD